MSQIIVTPRLAATLILLQDTTQGLEVMLVERSGKASFAAGKFVFPGGAVDAGDTFLDNSGLSDGALRVAAIRETYEECRLLLADIHGQLPDPNADFSSIVKNSQLHLQTQTLVPFAHWITPPQSPKRFDTHFFIAAAPAGQLPVADRKEVMSAVWSNPISVVEQAESEEINLMFATYMTLRWLTAFTSADQALVAARQRQIVTVIAESSDSSEGRILKIPEAAGFGETEVLEKRFRRT